ncbi:hemerythrin domain-containing protein [Cryptosporangium phraense]|uniref:Hemerythrin domain-containing protein n=1 Tax=Cryptosporangium phraense TaxID=2593070 RepID=A0A545AQ44_9ACTN|nr:hemerythrin domain-containing protein [Cryptosporangium phraense]TQS43458.1 hemerythrin domain-containing protein [Cryptosporangium phraense]
MTTETHHHTNRCYWSPGDAGWNCDGGGSERVLVDVRDMIVVHTAMLREFRLAPAAVRRTEAGDRRRARVVSGHLRFLTELLHHHHAGEDELLWPTLRARTSASAHRLIDDVEAQHVEIDVALRRGEELLDAWAQAPDAGRREQLAAALEHLHAVLKDHLDLEERALLPLAAGALTEGEWHAIGEAAVAAMPKPALALAFGMFAYEGEPEVLRAMVASAPPVPRTLLPLVAPRLYARRAKAVHGTAKP